MGIAIQLLATDLYFYEVGDKISSISEFQSKYQLARGTVQNALAYFKENNIIQTESKGSQGTILTAANKKQLRRLLTGNQLSGTMPLPYSKLYEGFATALYQRFQQNDIDLNMAYIRGSANRVEAVLDEKFDFGVLSRFAAEAAINDDNPIKIVLNFGSHTYLSKHVVVYRQSIEQPFDGMRIGIDYNSLDHVYLTQDFAKNTKAKEVFIPSNQLIYALRENQIDIGIWNYDEIVDKKIDDLYYHFIEPTEQIKKMAELVIICKKDNDMIESLIKEVIDVEDIISIQNKVKFGEITPRY